MDVIKHQIQSRLQPSYKSARVTSRDPFQGLPKRRKNYYDVPEVPQDERFLIHKIRLRWVCVVGMAVAIPFVIGTARTFCRIYVGNSYYYEDPIRCRDSALPEYIVTMFVSLYWSLRHLLDLLDKSLPWRPAFHKKMSNRFPFAFPKHPGWFVTGELFISGALITTAVFVSFVPTYEFNYDGIAGPAASIIAFFAAIGVGLLGACHFILFALACDDEHARRTGSNIPAVRRRVQELASTIISATETHHATNRKISPSDVSPSSSQHTRVPSTSYAGPSHSSLAPFDNPLQRQRSHTSSKSLVSPATPSPLLAPAATPTDTTHAQHRRGHTRRTSSFAAPVQALLPPQMESPLLQQQQQQQQSSKHLRAPSSGETSRSPKRASKFPGLVSRFNENFGREEGSNGSNGSEDGRERLIGGEAEVGMAPSPVKRYSWESGFEEVRLEGHGV